MIKCGMNVLVTGGAGYIGSITTRRLLEEGHNVVVFDSLERGHRNSVSCKLIIGNLIDPKSLASIQGTFDAVIHFAAYTLVEESMQKPFLYFQNNVLGGLNVLEFMRDRHIPRIVFSSSCSLYGIPEKEQVLEDDPKTPLSVYGETKLMFEDILKWYDLIYQIRYVNLRYFNAAGASLDGTLGENHNPETHIIPVAIETALGRRDSFLLFGDDYPTPDGTCVRDYIHVEDLASAHIRALEYLYKKSYSTSFNIGSGKGYSNREVLDMVKKISGKDFTVQVVAKREGDPAIIFADARKAELELGFRHTNSDLETIIQTAWDWHKKHKKED